MTLLLLALLGCAAPDCDATGTICVVAGTGRAAYDGEDLPARQTSLYQPTAVAVDADDRLLVVDFNNFLIRRLEPDGILATVAGNNTHAFAIEGPARDSPLENPIDVAVGPDGELYVAELHAGRILVVRDGKLAVIAGTTDIGFAGDGGPATEALLSEATGVEVGPDGTIYVADTGNHRIRAIRDGTIDTLTGGGPGRADGPLADARFRGPQRLHLDGRLLYVADTDNHAIRRIDLEAGVVETVLDVGLDAPFGVTAGDGDVWIADSGNHRVIRLRGTQVEVVADRGVGPYGAGARHATDGGLAVPADVALDAAGNLYVADMLNHVVRRVAVTPP